MCGASAVMKRGRTIEKIAGTRVIAASQCVSISSASSIAISAENRRLERKYHGSTPPTSVVAVNVTAIPDIAEALDRGTLQPLVRRPYAVLQNGASGPIPLRRERAGGVTALVRIFILQSLAQHAEREVSKGGEPLSTVEWIALP